ncbi:MAG: AvaI/BsoBI family type II restriction endonuclease [Xenococcaceae cyanobacterium MO_167.B52]|nr:AvaI/BsoBI family type II restriction endonuclease [Xenococcaceae cyanobacterium MO_167.B52]
MSYQQHIESYESLITPRHKIRSGFIELALEKNKQATPFIEEAKALRVIAKQAKNPRELLNIEHIKSSLLTASGISNKANQYFEEEDKQEAILGLIENFLEPSGEDFVDELVYRFLLTRGDSLGGIMRNLGGKLGEWKLTRILISTLSIYGQELKYLDRHSNKWLQTDNEPELEKEVKGLHWKLQDEERTLIYNLKVPIVRKNVDLNLFDCTPDEITLSKKNPEKYIALGELKGGIDPAGADEHWKTANSALQRIRESFSSRNYHPHTFFVGAAIEKSMAQEIYQQLENNVLSNCANLTAENQMVALCRWLIDL